MSDPAVRAATRYRRKGYPEADGLVGAAREALAPIRKECEYLKRINVPGDDVHMVIERLEKFIYSTEELER